MLATFYTVRGARIPVRILRTTGDGQQLEFEVTALKPREGYKRGDRGMAHAMHFDTRQGVTLSAEDVAAYFEGKGTK